MLFGRQQRRVKRILIVEDEPLVAFDNEMMVAGAGYEVVATVDSVREALAILSRELKTEASGDEEEAEERGVDLILTDISLAGERTGLDLAREARALGVPVLFATANPPDGGDQLALGVLLKPYSERRLKGALKAAEKLLSGRDKIRAPDGVIFYAPAEAA